jgi:hypothetical protein
MLLGVIILENFVFNKRPQSMWYFWSFMVPKSLIVFYIVYYPENIVGAPVDAKSFIVDACVGCFMMTLIGVQKIFKPRFIGNDHSKKGQINGMHVYYLKDYLKCKYKNRSKTSKLSKTMNSQTFNPSLLTEDFSLSKNTTTFFRNETESIVNQVQSEGE